MIISLPNLLRLKFLYLIQLVDIKLKNSEKHFALLFNDLLDQCNSTEETLVKKSRPSESLDTHSKLFTYLQEEILWKYLSMLFFKQAPDKIQPELELVELLESKQLMSHL